MKILTLISMSALIIGCSTFNRTPAKDKSKTVVLCSAQSKQSVDDELYWQIKNGIETDEKLEDLCVVSVLSLKPTQFAVGLEEVKRKEEKVASLSPKQLDKYTWKNPEPIVIGPRGEFYIIDHHHLARALDDAQIKSTYGIILENWSGRGEEDFFSYMKSKNWLYLVDHNGAKKTVKDLSSIKTVRDMRDDPYRSLAGQTRCKSEEKCTEGQWLKSEGIPFIEFLWAEHFRKTPAVAHALKNFGKTDFTKVTEAATEEVKRVNGKLPY